MFTRAVMLLANCHQPVILAVFFLLFPGVLALMSQPLQADTWYQDIELPSCGKTIHRYKPRCSQTNATISSSEQGWLMISIGNLGRGPQGYYRLSPECIRQDEPVSGNAAMGEAFDARIEEGQIFLRNISDPAGNGRVYHIDFTLEDPFQHSCSGSVAVLVPAASAAAVDDGTDYASLQAGAYCGGLTNTPPEIISSPQLTASEGQWYEYQVSALDADNDPVSYRLVEAPPAMSLGLLNGQLQWQPGLSDIGSHRVVVEANDNRGGFDRQTFFVSVSARANQPPHIHSTPELTVFQGAGYRYPVLASDSDDDTLYYQLEQSPAAMRIDPLNGELEWSTSYTDVGTHSISIRVSDSFAASAVQAYMLTVIPRANHQPEIVSQPVTEALSGGLYSYQLLARDEDGDRLQYRLLDAPDGMLISADSGLISWLGTSTGEYTVQVGVTDGQGGETMQRYVLQVLQQPQNQPPDIVSTPQQSVLQTSPFLYQPMVVDEQVNSLRFNYQGVEDSLFDPDTGAFFWVAEDDYPVFDRKLNPHCAINTASEQEWANTASWRAVNFQGSHAGKQHWVFTEDGKTAKAVGNGDPTILLSDIAVNDGVVEVLLRNEGGDDDWIGVVWGFQHSQKFYRLRWLRRAIHGLQISRIDSPQPRYDASHESDELLYENRELVWEYHQDYRLLLDIRPGRAVIHVLQEDRILDAIVLHGEDIHQGNFGFYVHSQDDVYYQARYLPRQAAPDLIVENVRYRHNGADGAASLQVDVFNRGAAATASPVALQVDYARDHQQYHLADPQTLAGSTVPPLPAAARYQLDLPISVLPADTGWLQLQLLAAESGVLECQQFNNRSLLPVAALTVQDQNNQEDSQQFAVNVFAANQRPMILSTAPVFAEWGSTYTYNVVAEDPNPGDHLRYQLLEGPEGMHFYPDSGYLVWPQATAVEGVVYSVRIRVSDLSGAYQDQQFDVQWQSRPQIHSQPPTIARQGERFYYPLLASDADGDALSYALLQAPDGMQINSQGEISWLPEVAGHFSEVVVAVDDGKSTTVTQAFTLAVLAPGEVNQAPVITSSSDISLSLLADYEYQITAVDADGDSLFYQLLEGPNAMVLDPENARLYWRPGWTQAGQHTVKIRVSDRRGGVAEQGFTLSVAGAGNNHAPHIHSHPADTVVVNHDYLYQLEVSDPELDDIQYQLLQAPEGMTLTAGGLLRWRATALPRFEPVRIRISDSTGNYSEQNFQLQVLAQSQIQQPLLLVSEPPLQAAVGQRYFYTVQLASGDIESLQLVLLQAPAGMSLDQRGLLSWLPETRDLGQHQIVLSLSSATGEQIQQQFDLLVLAESPAAISSLPASQISLGEQFQYRPQLDHGQRDITGYVLLDGPAGMHWTDSGELQWLPQISQLGQHRVVIQLQDAMGYTLEQRFVLDVQTIAAVQPDLQWQLHLPSQLAVTHSLQANLELLSHDNPIVDVALIEAPVGMTVNLLGQLHWQPQPEQLGLHRFAVALTDSTGWRSERTFQIAVVRLQSAPQLMPVPAQQVYLEQGLDLQLIASDPDGESLQWRLLQAPQGMQLTDQGRLQWQATADALGTNLVRVEVVDPSGLSASQDILLHLSAAGPYDRRRCQLDEW